MFIKEGKQTRRSVTFISREHQLLPTPEHQESVQEPLFMW